uniref:Chaperone protein DnaK n=1 Tax=Cyanoptyche gloeocystis TaxID=77922 RepID=A0A3G1IWI4_9EUKA|nr:heat shock protein 70 [Cyanoptyche gloeocystis]
MTRVVGIDLGTTNSVIAAMEGGKPTVITNAEGARITPSVVAYTNFGEILVGQIAKRQAVLNPANTFYSVKRFIGRKFDEVTEEAKQVPYKVIGTDTIKIECPALKKSFTPEEISAQILRKLVDDASSYFGEPVTKAVITVPAYFNDSQRQATKDAGKIAGLDVLRILNEPTAASLAYGFDKQKDETILVFDLGGGTFDVSILEVGGGVFEVLSTSGDTHLGGDDFDKRIVDWILDEFKKTNDIDLRNDIQALQRLTEAAEKAKIELSSVTQTDINLPFLTIVNNSAKHLDIKLNRAKFEELCADLVDRCKIPVENALADAKLKKENLDEVVLVGGSTRIPAVKELVKNLLNKTPNESVNPDEVVAVGAAVQAGILAGEVKDIVLLDVTPLSLGVEIYGGLVSKIIPRNTTIPTTRSEVFSTAYDGQTNVEICVLQGERELSKENKNLGTFRLDGIPAAPRGVPQIEVTFDLDVNGILAVTAKDRGTGRSQTITISGSSNLSKEDVEKMVKQAEEFAASDQERRTKIELKNQADALVYRTKKMLEKNEISTEKTQNVKNLVENLEKAISVEDFESIKTLSTDLMQVLAEADTRIANKEEATSESGNETVIDVSSKENENTDKK